MLSRVPACRWCGGVSLHFQHLRQQAQSSDIALQSMLHNFWCSIRFECHYTCAPEAVKRLVNYLPSLDRRWKYFTLIGAPLVVLAGATANSTVNSADAHRLHVP